MPRARVSIVLATVVVFAWEAPASAQPDVPREGIPQALSRETRALLEQLYSDNPVERAEAARELGFAARSQAIVPFLVGMLGDDAGLESRRSDMPRGTGARTNPGAEAAQTLGGMKSPRAFEPLRKALGSTSAITRGNAATALGFMQDPRALTPLLDTLKDPDAYVREHGAWALGNLGGGGAVDGLLASLRDEHADVRHAVGSSLQRLLATRIEARDRRITPTLIAALSVPIDDVRRIAASTLGDMKAVDAIAPLIAALGDQSDDVRIDASNALRNIGPPALEPLVQALDRGSGRARLGAALAIEYMDIPKTLSPAPFVVAMRDQDPYVRKSAARVLGELKALQATDLLVEALADDSIDVQENAARALGAIKDARAVEPLVMALERPGQLRQHAADALGWIGSVRAVDGLVVALRDTDEFVRMSAAVALGRIRDRRAVTPLRLALKDANEYVRKYAAEALQRIAPR